MGNISSLSNLASKALSLGNLILVSPQQTVGIQPQSKPVNNGNPLQQPQAILFHYEGEQTASLESDITDHYTEDNTAIQDQIALRPVTITTQGYIGELNNVVPEALAPLKAVADKLYTLSAFQPQLSITARRAYDQAVFLYATGASVLNSAVGTWSSLVGNGGTSVINGTTIQRSSNQTKQQVAFQQFFGYYTNRTLFTVQTPWAIFQNMAISRLRAIQNADTRMISDFEITFKQMRFASTLTTSSQSTIDGSSLQGRAANQAASLVNLGTSTPAATNTTLLSQVA